MIRTIKRAGGTRFQVYAQRAGKGSRPLDLAAAGARVIPAA
jgi:hypothetical protein